MNATTGKGTHTFINFHSPLLAVMLVVLLLGMPVWSAPRAQEKEKETVQDTPSVSSNDPALNQISQVFTPQFILPELLRDQLVSLYRDQIRVTTLNDKLIVRTWPQLMPAVADMIAQLDAPAPDKKNIEIKVYLVVAATDSNQPSAYPAILRPVITQLEKTFTYQSYHLVETLFLRSQENGEARSQGRISNQYNSLTGLSQEQFLVYSLAYKRIQVQSVDGENRISLDDFQFMCNPTSNSSEYNQMNRTLWLGTNLDIAEGQFAVVGKTSAEGTPNALILILTADLVE
ncbi:MAG: hypothetical protein JXQ27_03165 [Acidobacteria bacterium]|nr:hypothetical protein [Acidobacteriota bacterium]